MDMRKRALIWGVALTFLASASAYAEMYMYTDEAGVVVFTDLPNRKAVNLKQYNKKRVSLSSADYQEIIRRSAERYGLDHKLINAVVRVESNFDEYAISRQGALGLMQLMPSTASQLGVYNPFSPEQNIDGGVRYLKDLIERFDGDLRLALAAYNAGPTAVEKYGDVPPIPETQNYLKKISSHYSLKPGTASQKRRPVYRLVLKDGTILYTNSKQALANASRL